MFDLDKLEVLEAELTRLEEATPAPAPSDTEDE